MTRLKLIAHKWYVAFITFQHVIQFLYRATERIAGFKITIITEQDLEHEALHQEEDVDNEMFHEPLDPKDIN